MEMMFFSKIFGHQRKKYKSCRIKLSNHKFLMKHIKSYQTEHKDGTNYKLKSRLILNGTKNQPISMIHHSLKKHKNNLQKYNQSLMLIF